MSNDKLPLMEHFNSLQGEGFHAGKAAYFIRLGGCDVGCHWCDVKDSWDESKHPKVSVSEMVKAVVETGASIAVITGGEPLLHNLHLLTEKLQAAGIRTHLETSGSSTLSGNWNWITLSPKKFKAPLEEVLQKADELKIIVFNTSDFIWAEQHAGLVSANCKLYLQPEWDRASLMTPEIIPYIQSNPKWQLSLQTHKYLEIR